MNYLASFGYDKETNRIYMGVQDIIPPYYGEEEVSDRGQIYVLTPSYRIRENGTLRNIDTTDVDDNHKLLDD